MLDPPRAAVKASGEPPCRHGKPARLEEAGNTLAAHPKIPFVAATTGPTNLVASAVFRDTRHLYGYLTSEPAGLPGVSSVQTVRSSGRSSAPAQSASRRRGRAGP
jgi:Lrp/AsnC ligand binding domain